KAGNMPVDLLHCVPPSSIADDGNGHRHSLLAKAFAGQSWESWDAVDEKVCRSFPRSANSMRIVQYESCRGLEGWTTVLEGLDEFWEMKHGQAFGKADPASIDAGTTATAVAWRWTMIPLTR